MPIAVLDPNFVNVYIFRFAFLGVDRFYLFEKVSEGLIILSEAVINVAGDSVAVPSIPSVVITVFALFVFVNVVKWPI